MVAYDYLELTYVDDADIKKYVRTVRGKADQITKAWSKELSTEWMMRNYQAMKVIFGAQLMLDVATYSEAKNIRLTVPYLVYYSIFNSCRALMLTDPFNDWNDHKLAEVSHIKVCNYAVAAVKRLDPQKGEQLNEFFNGAKAHRELLSYKFPAQGLRQAGATFSIEAVGDWCSLVCELAEMNSECLYASWEKVSGVHFSPDSEKMAKLVWYDGETTDFADDDDARRLAYLIRKYEGPPYLVSIATAGMVEDIYGAWCEEESEHTVGNFNPDHHDGPRIFRYRG